MGTITLEGIEFFAHHGFYKEERKIGNRFEVDFTVGVDFSQAGKADALNQTVNYEDLYQIVFKVMTEPSKLLESLAYRIIQESFEKFEEISFVDVNISKHNPPVGGVCKKAKINMRLQRSEWLQSAS